MIIIRVPLRLEFLGGSTDIKYFYEKHKGYVLNAALDKYIYLTINQNLEKNIKVVHDVIETKTKANHISHSRIREILKSFGITQGVEIFSISDITSKGSGLGSSSSFTVGLIQGLSMLTGKKVSTRELAEAACHIEIDVLKEPIGKQDQYAAAFGGLNLLTFNTDGYVGRKEIILKPKVSQDLSKHLMVFYTGTPRSASDILKKQKENISNKMPYLKLMADLVVPATRVLEAGDLKSFAGFLEKEWNIKKNLSSDITNKSLEKMYAEAKEAGAWGGRVSGAGGGGFMLLIVPPKNHEQVKVALSKYTHVPISFVKKGSEVIFRS